MGVKVNSKLIVVVINTFFSNPFQWETYGFQRVQLEQGECRSRNHKKRYHGSEVRIVGSHDHYMRRGISEGIHMFRYAEWNEKTHEQGRLLL